MCLSGDLNLTVLPILSPIIWQYFIEEDIYSLFRIVFWHCHQLEPRSNKEACSSVTMWKPMSLLFLCMKSYVTVVTRLSLFSGEAHSQVSDIKCKFCK